MLLGSAGTECSLYLPQGRLEHADLAAQARELQLLHLELRLLRTDLPLLLPDQPHTLGRARRLGNLVVDAAIGLGERPATPFRMLCDTECHREPEVATEIRHY